MRVKDPEHWLYRLDAEEWLRAAAGELARAEAALAAKQQRAGVTQARRAAGMAWNAVLFATEDETAYGRSYMEHVEALARDASAPEPVRAAALALVETPLATDVVKLGKGDTSLARAVETILAYARERTAGSTSA